MDRTPHAGASGGDARTVDCRAVHAVAVSSSMYRPHPPHGYTRRCDGVPRSPRLARPPARRGRAARGDGARSTRISRSPRSPTALIKSGGGPALLFRNVKGSPHAAADQPVRAPSGGCAWRFGVERLDDLGDAGAERARDDAAARACVDKIRALGKLKSLADSRPKTVRSGPCQEVVLDPPDLDALPIMTCWPKDGGPFITLPAVITKRPADRACATWACTGSRSSTRRRPRCTGRSTRTPPPTGGGWASGWRWRSPSGLDPVTAYSASAPLPKHVDEFMLAGFLRGEPVELVQARDGRPRGAGPRRDRDRGLRREGRAARRGAVRRPHRLLHAGRAVPGAPRHRRHHAPRRRSTPRSWSACRRPRTSGWARPPSGCSCRRSG